MKKNDKINLAATLFLFSIVIIELICDRVLIKDEWNELFCFVNVWQSMLFYVTLCLFAGSFFYNRHYLSVQLKNLKDILKTLIKNSVSGRVIDILFVLFFLLHLTWIPNSIFEYAKCEQSGWHPFIFLSGMLLAILAKPQLKKEELSAPLVMLTGISNISDRTLQTILEPLDEVWTRDEYDSRYIQKMIIFMDPGIGLSLNDLERIRIDETMRNKCESFTGSTFIEKKEIVYDILRPLVKENIQIELVECGYEKIQLAFDIISVKVNELLFDKYTDEHLLFNLTPGNKNISIALSLNSIQGKRRSCYLQQSNGRLEAEELDVFKIKDVFSELLDQ